MLTQVSKLPGSYTAMPVRDSQASMGIVGGQLGYMLLRKISPPSKRVCAEQDTDDHANKIDLFFGDAIQPDLDGKVVIDFGCGTGREAVALAQRGARQVIGLDIRQSMLEAGRKAAERERVADRCTFCQSTTVKADTIVSCDAFEHFADPAGILDTMCGLIAPGGSVWITFGPPWLHPRGGHLFSVFPWSHLVFTESALCRWRRDFKTDRAQRFEDVEGGLNQMTVRRFEKVVDASPFRIDWLKLTPIRAVRWLHGRLTREYFTSTVKCRLLLK